MCAATFLCWLIGINRSDREGFSDGLQAPATRKYIGDYGFIICQTSFSSHFARLLTAKCTFPSCSCNMNMLCFFLLNHLKKKSFLALSRTLHHSKSKTNHKSVESLNLVETSLKPPDLWLISLVCVWHDTDGYFPQFTLTMPHLKRPHNQGNVFALRAVADNRCPSLIGVISLAWIGL